MGTVARVIGYIWLGAVIFCACGFVVAWALSKMGERLRGLDFEPWDVFDEDPEDDDDYLDWLERRYRWHTDR